MKRRDFLKYGSSLGTVPFLLNGVPLRPFATAGMLDALACDILDRVLVIVQLKGGNDAINNIVPLNQYDTYASLRPNIKIPENKLIRLDQQLNLLSNNQEVGLNPALLPFYELYNEGYFHIIQGVGYPQPNRSHFKSTDLWLTGGDGLPENFHIPTGWIGRYLDQRFPDYEGKPTDTAPDPLGIQFGDRKPSLGFHLESEHAMEINLATQDPGGFYTLVSGIGGGQIPFEQLPDSELGDELRFIMGIENSTAVYAERIQQVYNNAPGPGVEYGNFSLASQLKSVARMLAGGSQTKVFLVQHGGFDTHVNQVEGGDNTTGIHANLLSSLAEALASFQADLINRGIDQRVLTITFSEFGRKAIENGNMGTDHGTFAPMYLMGTAVQPGMSGTNLDLSHLDQQGAPNPDQLQNDYRKVFGSLLQDWLGANDEALATSLLLPVGVEKLNLVHPNQKVDPACYFGGELPPPPQTRMKVNVFLEGFYQPADGSMHNLLRTRGWLSAKQPFKDVPFGYDGLEQIEHEDANVVDWVLIEVRALEDPSQVLARRAALLATDTRIRDIDFSDTVLFNDLADGDYYVALFHRNHLPVISAGPVSFDLEEPPLYSFTSGADRAMGEGALKKLHPDNNHWGMIAGDFDQNGVIDALDYEAWRKKAAFLEAYQPEDADGNGIINHLDMNLMRRNQGKKSVPEDKF